MLIWRPDGAILKGSAPRGAPAALVSAKPRRETSQVEVLLVSHREIMVPLQADGWEEVPKSVRDLGWCSLQDVFEVWVGVEDGKVCPKM